MSEYGPGLAIVATFACFALLMYARIVPALLAVPLMALAMAALSGVNLAGLATLTADGSIVLATVYVTVIFGAMLGRVTMETGIAETIVNYAAEFGGDRPFVLTLTLCAAVAVLFTSLTGLGAIIMVGSIVLPIMMTVGVNRKTAATLFLLAFALGFIFNIGQWTFYLKTFGVAREQMQGYAAALFALDLVVLVVYALVRFRSTRGYATWTIAADAPVAKRSVPWFALVTPLLPIVLFLGFKTNAIVAFGLAALFGVLTTRPRAAIPTLVASAIRGLEDVAPAVLLFVGIGMLLTATKTPQVAHALAPIVRTFAPHSALSYVILFGLASPLALYRGPLNPFGVGIGVYTVLAALGVMPPFALVAAIMAVVQVQNVCDPTNTQNVWVANYTGVPVDEITKLTLPYQVAVACAGCIAAVVFGAHLFGKPAFAWGVPRAAAAEMVPAGLFAPGEARGTIGIVGAADAPSQLAADTIARELASWSGIRVVSAADDANHSDCSRKPYVALARVNADLAPSQGAAAADVGLELVDCGGWGVDEWHAHRELSQTAGDDDVRRLALAALFRFRVWTHERPRLWQTLSMQGLAFDPSASKPTYYYSLFKTVDGYMRAMVRPGGPAYAAGLRTNDIVDKLDGKFWWEYGTYQTQLRAYDGKPHRYEITRGTRQVVVQLAEPYRGEGIATQRAPR